ncbi:MAG: homocysteine S-methyltransferase family protein [Chloroflexi bacterium]|nr:homocysteine S-methyltransferase family protein [Chloroflexota bacterium]
MSKATPPFTNRRYLDAIDDHVVIFDGAMGTSIQSYELTPEDFGGEPYQDCIDYLVITRPDVIREIHESFLRVGAEAIETNTFRSNRRTLDEHGLGERTIEINRAAAEIARAACDDIEAESGILRFVAGSMGPSGMLPSGDDPDLSDITFDELADLFGEQARGLVEGGADMLLLETSQDILEVKAAVYGVNRYFAESGGRIPLQVQITLDVGGRMLFGTDITGAVATLSALSIDVLGMNCSTGPEYMRLPIQYLIERSPFPISVLPNAGLPINVDGEAVYPMLPVPFSEMVAEFARWGVNAVGGCCGTTPEHIALLYERVHGVSYDETLHRRSGRRAPTERDMILEPRASSGMTAARMIQDPGPTLIGERVNSQGSRKVKRLLLEEDYEGIVEIAVGQVNRGAHMLDVCVALTERDDEKAQMEKLVKKLSMAVEAPLIIDTTEADVAEAALALYPGRGIINGNNLENGRERIDAILPIAVKHGAAVLSMTIDEEGMAHSRGKKLEIARRISDIAVNEYGLTTEDLVFDTLTFPLTTGQEELRNDAVETLEGIRLIKEQIPGVMTALGISNVSFGVGAAARGVLNSVFLYHAVKAGLDMAIVNPAHITPYFEIPDEQRAVAEDLIFNSDADALPRFIQYFEENEVQIAGAEEIDPTADMTSEGALHWQIVHRKKEGVEALIDDILTRMDAVGALNTVLLPAMKEVGDKFGAGELILPFVLQSAEVMKKSVAYLEQFMDKVEGASKGIVVLATVYGDVHDIGKNLVKTILSNNGYTVHDLGKQVPANTIIDKALELEADAIGLSALLVSTSKQMPLIVNELARRGLDIPVLVGGAAINRRFGRRILFLQDSGEPYMAGVFYCKDAFEGLAAVEQLLDAERHEQFLDDVFAEAYAEVDRAPRRRRARRGGVRKTVRDAPDIPTPPFWGARVVRSMPLEIVLQHLHKPELFRLSWGAKNTQGVEWERLSAEFEARLLRMSKDAARHATLQPQAVYAYLPVNSEGDDLLVWDAERYAVSGETVEAARFSFPRQPDGETLCISDYFAAIDSGSVDVMVLQAVTVGHEATDEVERLQAANEYSEAYFFHGLAVQAAEATANYLTHIVEGQLGIAAGRGKRYSWGYPACPELADHDIVLRLLPQLESELGMSLTESWQWLPEQSTAALFTHHPDAKYYSVGNLDRAGQILG